MFSERLRLDRIERDNRALMGIAVIISTAAIVYALGYAACAEATVAGILGVAG